jgi:hypothetical protein
LRPKAAQLIVGAQMLGMAIAEASFLLVSAHHCFTMLLGAHPPRGATIVPRR